MIARACTTLLGDGLEATRLVRAAETLNQLDIRVRGQREWQERTRQNMEDAQRDMVQRERACKLREETIVLAERYQRDQHAQIKLREAELAQALSLIREGEPDGPARATGELTDSGVAPL